MLQVKCVLVSSGLIAKIADAKIRGKVSRRKNENANLNIYGRGNLRFICFLV